MYVVIYISEVGAREVVISTVERAYALREWIACHLGVVATVRRLEGGAS